MSSWKSTLIGPQTSLKGAIAAIDNSALRIAIVVDPDNRLLGTVTDGDVRRALLRNSPLDIPVAEVMCDTPLAAERDWSRERVLAIMENSAILQMPVIDKQGRVVGLETLHGLLNKRQFSNPVLLMAGGFGSRLHPLTQNCPKPLLKVGDKPILEIILERCINAGFSQFYISTHYMSDMVRDHFGDGRRWGVSISYVHEDTPLGTAGALGLLPHDEIHQPMLIMNGDVMTALNFAELLHYHEQHGSLATMCVREYEYQVPYGVIQSEGHLIRSMVEKPVHKYFVNAGVYVLSPDLIRTVSSGTPLDMPLLLEQAISAGQHVAMFPLHEYWLDVGRPDDFQRAQSEVDYVLK